MCQVRLFAQPLDDVSFRGWVELELADKGNVYVERKMRLCLTTF